VSCGIVRTTCGDVCGDASYGHMYRYAEVQ
jgi:hypothetical protein